MSSMNYFQIPCGCNFSCYGLKHEKWGADDMNKIFNVSLSIVTKTENEFSSEASKNNIAFNAL